MYGGLPGPEALADASQANAFLAQVRQLPRPKVLSTYYLSLNQPDKINPRWQDGTFGFRLLPQRFVPDTHILSDLVWDRVGIYEGRGRPFTLFVSMYDGPYRGVPRGLDVFSVFGSARAERILQDEGDTEYSGYEEKVTELRQLYARGEHGRDLYHRWLRVLRTLLATPPPAAPAFMQSDAWGRKQLNAALGSWAELRHDTILYIKQSYTSVARGISLRPPEPRAYLEPCPQVYRGLGEMTAHMREQLTGWGMLDPGVSAKLSEFEALLVQLGSIADKELQGELPDQNESQLLENIGGQLKALLAFPPELLSQITSGTDDRMAVVADVHTLMEGDMVLEEAVGDPFLICVDLEGEQYWGAVFSYYEFKHPMKDRLTDEAWQAMSPKPPPPPWTAAYLAAE